VKPTGRNLRSDRSCWTRDGEGHAGAAAVLSPQPLPDTRARRVTCISDRGTPPIMVPSSSRATRGASGDESVINERTVSRPFPLSLQPAVPSALIARTHAHAAPSPSSVKRREIACNWIPRACRQATKLGRRSKELRPLPLPPHPPPISLAYPALVPSIHFLRSAAQHHRVVLRFCTSSNRDLKPRSSETNMRMK